MLKAVELSYQRDNMKELADGLNLWAEMLYRWRSEFVVIEGVGSRSIGRKTRTEEESELDRLPKAPTSCPMPPPTWTIPMPRSASALRTSSRSRGSISHGASTICTTRMCCALL